MKRLVRAWYYGILHRCHHVKTTEKFATAYSLLLACIFVSSLYVLVPRTIRRLERDDPRQIKFRAFATFLVSLGSVVTYPLLFCDVYDGEEDTWSIVRVMFRFRNIRGVLLHTMLLYTGPMVATLLRIYDIRQRLLQRGKQSQHSFVGHVIHVCLKPTVVSLLNPVSETERWVNIRTYLAAPVTEEVVFRGCVVPALLSTGMSPVRAALVAPLFFGIAHLHHAMLRFRQGEGLPRVALITFFQFTYTSLFGSYAAYAFIRTGSVPAVIASHMYCNWMGLPDMSFLQSNSPLYDNRTWLVAAYILGAFAFKWFLSSDYLLPLPSTLPTMVRGSDVEQI